MVALGREAQRSRVGRIAPPRWKVERSILDLALGEPLAEPPQERTPEPTGGPGTLTLSHEAGPFRALGVARIVAPDPPRVELVDDGDQLVDGVLHVVTA